jgi:hypothetical protein
MSSIMGGTVFCHHIDGWDVAWESSGEYRHWCRQTRRTHSESVLAVLMNPGSLSGDGSNLRRDTTLRILRVVGQRASINWVIVNLFDLATPKPGELHVRWRHRDSNALVFEVLDLQDVPFVLFAHGNVGAEHEADSRSRITTVRSAFAPLREIHIPRTKAGHPVHPMNWQRQRLMSDVVGAIVAAKRGA